jgi:hypothetical protein
MLKHKLISSLGLAGSLALLLTLGSVLSQVRGQQGRNLLFIQQDKVIAFNPSTGLGQQVGTATGRINGATIVKFQFTITGAFTFSFDNRAGITDTDGDQVIFKNVGTGKFIVPGVIDGTSPFGPIFGIGGPLTGTYEAVAASGKYKRLLGRKFPYRAVASNPFSASPDPNALGSVYVEVYSDGRGDPD